VVSHRFTKSDEKEGWGQTTPKVSKERNRENGTQMQGGEKKGKW